MTSTSNLKTLVFLCLCLFSTLLHGQDIENTYQQIKEKMTGPILKVKGGINASLLGAYSNSNLRRADPFAWRLNGQLQFDFYGIKMPVSLLMSSRSTVFNYQLPAYTFVGLRPSYRWASLHLGNSNMSFSPYTLSGHSFQGVGVELKPGIWRLSAMRGQLRRAGLREVGQLQAIDPTFRRMAWGIKAGIDTGKEHFDLTLFKAGDQFNLLAADSLSIQPKENLVLGLAGRKNVSQNLFVAVNYAASFLTRDARSGDRIDPPSSLFTLGLLDFKNSTALHKALKTSFGLKTNFGRIEIHHEWVDPGYRSLGTLFFNDDLENITASSTFSLLNKKLNVHANLGVQRNNLSGYESTVNRRFVGTVNATYSGLKALTLNLNYSNFSSTNRLRSLSDPLDLLDSIKLVLVNQQLNVAANYSLGAEKKSMLNAQFSIQKGNAIQNDEVLLGQQNQYYLGQLSHTYLLSDQGMSLSSSLMLNIYENQQLRNTSIAPTLSFVLPLLKDQLKWTTVLSYLYQRTNPSQDSKISNWQNQLSFSWDKKHRLQLQMGVIHRHGKGGQSPTSLFESRGRLTYAWNF